MQQNNMIHYNIQDFIQYLPHQGVIIGLDFGKKKIGVALSNYERTMSLPICTIENSGDLLKEYIESNNISGIVIGLPVNMDGSYGESVEKVLKFANKLNGKTG